MLPTIQNNTRYTPRELINHHMAHPEDPITDADIENLVLEVPVKKIAEEWYEEFLQEKEAAEGGQATNGNHYELPSVY